ncbi:hypothetical protein P3X46_002824 [Hevea brasiliensis]|uniref:Malectin-like domain-containing protein n=1 Tax=Hevea brasiliensis TaxID=3981 RepID=A0ABQ9N510_HEVBR|nr:hypothetical protein P3X46_002824 [Hevea brasiliensis]
MKPCPKSLHIIIFLLLCFSFFYLKDSLCADNISYVPIENIALDCGSYALQTLSFDGRNRTGDVRSKFVAFNRHTNSTVSTASSMDPGVSQVPYKTARLFYSEFTYIFNVTPGPKFVRLYFYPYFYSGLDASKAILSVTCGHHTLLSNFSASLAANYNNVYTFFKEFIIHAKNHSLHLTFSPSSNASDAFEFVNGIEVVSMPLHLYVRGEDAPLPFVAYSAPIRLDDQYVFGAAFGQLAYDFDLNVSYTPTVSAYTAPVVVYRPCRFMGTNAAINLNYNLNWFFPVEIGIIYLVRLHSCELDRNITKINQRVFSIYINNQTAQDQADVIAWSGGQGIPVYKDYIAKFPQERERIQDLWGELHPNTKTKPQYYDAILNGVEIFKLSNSGGELAVVYPPQGQGSLVNPSFRTSGSSKKRLLTIIGCSVSGVVLVFLILISCACLLSGLKQQGREKIKARKAMPSHSVPISI